MEKERFGCLLECAETAFLEISAKMLSFSFEKGDKLEYNENNLVVSIVGVVGSEKGRIIFKTGEKVAKNIVNSIIGESIDNDVEFYQCIAEFSNIFCGRTITLINNKYEGKVIRLTPPAIFAGINMEIVTPNVPVSYLYFNSEYGPVTLEIGFEGGC